MTSSQILLLKKLIEADRAYRSKLAVGESTCNEYRGVEINWGVHPKTANYLVEKGLAEIVEVRPGQAYIFLGKYEPLDKE